MLLLALIACNRVEYLGPPSPAVMVRIAPAVTHDLDVAHGPVGRVWVRAINTHGATVPGGDVQVMVDGAPVDVDVSDGQAMFELPEPGLHEITVDGVTAEVASYGGAWAGYGGLSIGHQAPAAVTGVGAYAGNGLVFHQDNTVWWTSPEGRMHTALVAAEPILAVRQGHLDGDDVLDLAVATVAGVHLLRGRRDGGLDWFAQMIGGLPLVAMDIGDADGDLVSDIAMVWRPISGDVLDVWRGDGLLGFTGGPVRRLVTDAFDVTVADTFGDGGEVAVSNEDLDVDFFYARDPLFAPTGPNLLVELPPNGTAHSPGDYDGDGLEEMFFAAPYDPVQPLRLEGLELGDEPTLLTLGRDEPAHFGFGDLTRDGRFEVLFAEDDGNLVVAHHNGEQTVNTTLVSTPGGPVAAMDAGRVMIAESEAWHWFQIDPANERPVRLRNRLLRTPGVRFDGGAFDLDDIDQDGTAEVVGNRIGGTTTQLRVYSVDAEQVVERSRITLDDQVRGTVDVQICDQVAWVLLDVSVHAIDISDPDNPVSLGSNPIQGRDLACTSNPLAPAAVLGPVGVIQLDADTDILASTTTQGEGVWLDAEGFITCETNGCGVVRVQTATGSVVFRGDPTNAWIDGEPAPGAGKPQLIDADGNGLSDVLYAQAGQLVLYRQAAGGFGPPVFLRTDNPFQAPVASWDYDGDGLRDLWTTDPENGVLRVTADLAEPDLPPPDTGDTSDTGSADTGTPSTGDTGSP